MDVIGNENLINGIKLTVRGSFSYGYGSMYGINQVNIFGLDKPCDLLITGAKNTIENCIAKKIRGGILLYLGGDAVVTNSSVVDCGSTNFNLPADGVISNQIREGSI